MITNNVAPSEPNGRMAESTRENLAAIRRSVDLTTVALVECLRSMTFF